MSERSRCCEAWLLGLCLFPLAGCSSSDPERQPMAGRVSAEGVTIEKGSISFLPAEGNRGPAAISQIASGRYSFSRDTGPTPGPHRVVIDIDQQPGAAADSESPIPEDIKFAPTGRPRVTSSVRNAAQQRRLHWELEYVVPEEGSTNKDFDLGG